MSSGVMSSRYRSAISAVSMCRSYTTAILVALDGLSLPASILPRSHEGTKSRRRTRGAALAIRLCSSSSRHFCCNARASVSVHASSRRTSLRRPVRGHMARTRILATIRRVLHVVPTRRSCVRWPVPSHRRDARTGRCSCSPSSEPARSSVGATRPGGPPSPSSRLNRSPSLGRGTRKAPWPPEANVKAVRQRHQQSNAENRSRGTIARSAIARTCRASTSEVKEPSPPSCNPFSADADKRRGSVRYQGRDVICNGRHALPP